MWFFFLHMILVVVIFVLRYFFVSDLKAAKREKLQARKVRTRKIACMKVVN